MKKLVFYNSKLRHIVSLFFWTILIVLFCLQINYAKIRYWEILLLVIPTCVIIYDLLQVINKRPALIIDADRINFPLKSESVYWDNIYKIDFYNQKGINESIAIKVKVTDNNRKKSNVPRVYDDYDDTGYLDFSTYEIDLEKLNADNQQIIKFIADLSRKNKIERELQLQFKFKNLINHYY